MGCVAIKYRKAEYAREADEEYDKADCHHICANERHDGGNYSAANDGPHHEGRAFFCLIAQVFDRERKNGGEHDGEEKIE